MEESRHMRIALDEITPSPEKGVYVTQEELKKYVTAAMGMVLLLFLSLFAGRKD